MKWPLGKQRANQVCAVWGESLHLCRAETSRSQDNDTYADDSRGRARLRYRAESVVGSTVSIRRVVVERAVIELVLVPRPWARDVQDTDHV